MLATALDAADRGAPLSTEKLKNIVTGDVQESSVGQSTKGPFKNGVPSQKYVKNLSRSNPTAVYITRRLMQQGVRFNAVNGESVPNHYATIGNQIKENGLTVDQIFNVDEMGMSPERYLAKCSRQRFLLRNVGDLPKRTIESLSFRITTM